MTEAVVNHLRKLQGSKFIRGAKAWQYANRMANLAGIKQASGTTDLDAICFHLEVILGKKQRHIVSPKLGTVLLLLAFLRVYTSRRTRGTMPKICHNNPKLSLLMSEVHNLLAMKSASNLRFLQEWWDSLDIKPPKQHIAAGRKRKNDNHANTDIKGKLKRRKHALRGRKFGKTVLSNTMSEPNSPISGWELDAEQDDQHWSQSTKDLNQNARLVRCLSTGTVHLIQSNGSCYCIWRYSEHPANGVPVDSTTSEHRCPVCFARRERQIFGAGDLVDAVHLTGDTAHFSRPRGTDVHIVVLHQRSFVIKPRNTGVLFGGAAHATFRQLGALPEKKDPLESGMQKLKTKIAEHSLGLASDWNNFFASVERQKLLIDLDSLSHIDTPEKFKADCEKHVKEIMEAQGVLNLDDCIAKARDVPNETCFHKLDAEAFSFIAQVYGTDVCSRQGEGS